MMFKVTVTFDRVNPQTQALEKDSVREGELDAKDHEDARTKYLKIFRGNEPTRKRIKKVEVVQI